MIQAYYVAPDAKKAEQIADVDRIGALWREATGLLWVDLQQPTPEETDLLADRFNLHPVVVDMCREVTAQPLVHDYDQYLFMVIHAVSFRAQDERVTTLELDIVWGRHVVLTYHRRPIRAVSELREAAGTNLAGMMARGAGAFLHALVDRVIDNFQPSIDRIDGLIAECEKQIFIEPTREVLQRLLGLRRSAAHLIRVGAAQRDVVGRIVRGEFPQLGKQDLAYWRDAYDHLVRMVQAVEAQRDLIASARDAYLSVISNRMNEIMKVLTIIATIFIPITFVAGLYGMNFDCMPELHEWWGYPAALAVMALIAGGMLLYFHRKGWL
ncbi:MAG: magnesium/cobalt transporter CorA [Planctomycetes bacterium]|nr:magnesium/cobalt transporter CorA [Planctomycetota bacterium]